MSFINLCGCSSSKLNDKKNKRLLSITLGLLILFIINSFTLTSFVYVGLQLKGMQPGNNTIPQVAEIHNFLDSSYKYYIIGESVYSVSVIISSLILLYLYSYKNLNCCLEKNRNYSNRENVEYKVRDPLLNEENQIENNYSSNSEDNKYYFPNVGSRNLKNRISNDLHSVNHFSSNKNIKTNNPCHNLKCIGLIYTFFIIIFILSIIGEGVVSIMYRSNTDENWKYIEIISDYSLKLYYFKSYWSIVKLTTLFFSIPTICICC